ncbi:MAG: hypothetical protein U0176_21160 [Bacteroidia bacterium]
MLISECLPAQTYWGLDSSFNGTGFRIEPNPTGEYIGATLTMTDGRIVVAGTNINGPSGMLLVRQYLENGDPDPSFGTNGYAMANYRQVEGVVLGLGMQSTGKIILAGGEMTNQVHPIVERLLPNGDLDTSFGQSGIVDIPNAGGAQYGMRVFVLPDDRIVIGYRIGFPPQLKFGSCRLLPDGEVDLTYGVNGFATMVGPSGSLRHNAVAMDAQYRLIFAGPRGVTIPNGNYLARMDSSGFADSEFWCQWLRDYLSGMFNDFRDVVCHPNGSCYPLGFGGTGQLRQQCHRHRKVLFSNVIWIRPLARADWRSSHRHTAVT